MKFVTAISGAMLVLGSTTAAWAGTVPTPGPTPGPVLGMVAGPWGLVAAGVGYCAYRALKTRR